MEKMIKVMLSALLVLCLIAAPVWAAETDDTAPALPSAQPTETAVISAEDIQALLLQCTGYAGTAGSSLKNAIAAYGVLSFCIENNLAYAKPAELSGVLLEAYAQLSLECAQELAWNMESIADLIEVAFIDFVSAEGLFDSAGIAEDMERLLEIDGAYGDWAVFCLQLQRVLTLAGE